MAVAHDAATEDTFTTVSPHTVVHTPTGVPRGVLVLIGHGSSSDLVTGVTCNGVTMAHGNMSGSDTAGEPGRVEGFFLGENVVPGDQSISITHTGSADVKWVVVLTVTANRSVERLDTTQFATNQDQANPSITVSAGTQTGLAYGILYSGHDAVASISLGAGLSAIHNHDFGSFVARVDRQTTPAAGDFTFGYTATSEDVALMVVTIGEVDTVLFDGVGVCVEAAFGYNPTDTPGWYDLTSRVRSLSFGRGRSHELDTIQAGSASILLDNQDGELNANNTASAWYPNVKPMTPIRIVADYSGTSYPLWYGFVDAWPVSFPGQVDAEVDVSAVDLFKLLALRFFPVAQSSVVSALEPDAWWRFTNTGTTDESGNSHTLTFSGGPTTDQAGVWTNDESVDFDGSNDYATVASETVLEYVDVDMTVAAWVNPDTLVGVDILMGSFAAGGTVPSWSIGSNGGAVEFRHSTNTWAAGALTAGTWNHVAVTRSFSGGTATIRWYVNGALVYTDSTTTATAAFTRTVYIATSDTSSNMWDGKISEIALWGVALTAAEISSIYAAQSDLLESAVTSARIAAVLTEAGFTDYDLETGVSTMSASTDTAGSFLDEIMRAVDTEGGLFFIAPNGQPRFQDRHWRTLDQATPIDTFDDTGGLSYVEIVPSYDDAQIWNEIVVTANGAEASFTATDAASIESYGQRRLSLNTYPADANEATDRANWTLGIYKEPATRIDTLVCKPRGDSALWPILFDAEISNRYTISKTLAGDDLSQDVYLEAISFDFQPKDCTVTLQLSPASTQSFWLLGEAGFSELDDTTILGF